MPCLGLVEIIEKEGRYSDKIDEYINKIFSSYNIDEIGVIVLGCTHYVFIKDIIANIVGKDVAIVDGNLGTVRHVKNLLQSSNKLNSDKTKGCKKTKIKLINSSRDSNMLALSKKLLEEG